MSNVSIFFFKLTATILYIIPTNIGKMLKNLAATEDSSASPLTLHVVTFLSPNLDRQHFQKSVPAFSNSASLSR